MGEFDLQPWQYQPSDSQGVAGMGEKSRQDSDDDDRAPNEWIVARIANLREAGQSKDQKGLAAHLGLPKQRVTEIVKGTRKIAPTEIPLIAQYLDMSELEVIDAMAHEMLLPATARQRLVRGIIEADVFRPADKLVPDPKMSPLFPDKRWPKAEQVVFEVRDAWMAEYYPPGSYLLTVGIDEIGRKPRVGDDVICERRQGRAIEMTCWRATAIFDGKQRSKLPLVRPGVNRNGSATIEHRPVAIVVGAYLQRG